MIHDILLYGGGTALGMLLVALPLVLSKLDNEK